MKDFTPFEKARARTVLRHPFFGVLLLRLDPLEDRSCQTAWVDGVHLGYNPEWFASLTETLQEFVLCHEVMHIVLRHHTRRQERDPGDWNIAGDHAINLILQDAGHQLWDRCYADPKYTGWDAYRIYDAIHQEQSGPGGGDEGGDEGYPGKPGSQPGNQDGDESDESGNAPSDEEGDEEGDESGAGGDESGNESGGQEQGDDPGGTGGVRDLPSKEGGEASEVERRESEAEWQIAAESAAKVAMSRGKLPGNLRSLITELGEPEVNWREVLRDFIARCVDQDYTWSRPNRRHIASGLYLPTLQGERLPPVMIGVDTSGSMSNEVLAQVGAEVRSILADFDTSVTVMYCDTQVNRVDQYDDPDDLELHALGRGGTYLSPLFEHVAENVDSGEWEQPAFMLVFTDLYIESGIEEPDYPVLWVTQSKDMSGPFGETVYFDEHRRD